MSANQPAVTSPNDAATVRVWDPLVRIFHWSLVIGFTVAYLTEDADTFHEIVGYIVAGLIGFRLIWGLIGPRYARFTDFVTGPAKVRAYLGNAMRLRAPRYIGHNPAGGAMVMALLSMVAVVSLTGWLAIQPGAGGWLEDAHEAAATLTLVFVAAHVAGVIVTGLVHGENLVKSMFTGIKRV
ncbi:MAG: cytochrome b/b6 domain-containing protein [Hyphomicrobiales bacterium]